MRARANKRTKRLRRSVILRRPVCSRRRPHCNPAEPQVELEKLTRVMVLKYFPIETLGTSDTWDEMPIPRGDGVI